MRTSTTLLVALAVLAGAAGRLQAWGQDVHRTLTGRALDGLSEPLRSFFADRRAFVVEHSVDPDLWRVVDARGALGAEAPNHFLDIDALDEPPPYDGVPRDWKAFVARYGRARANRAGRLPWRTEEMYGRLVRAMADAGRNGPASYAADDARYLGAVLAHYVEDAFVPFHAVANYDGQLTGQSGIHSRFETALPRRYAARLNSSPGTVTAVPDVKAFIFATLADSAALAAPVLAADREARHGSDYDDRYYDALFAKAGPILQRRMDDAASGVASVLTAAWIGAGRPDLSPRAGHR